jgi:WD repeat-containing protein 48
LIAQEKAKSPFADQLSDAQQSSTNNQSDAVPRSSLDPQFQHTPATAESLRQQAGNFEILCNDIVLPNNMTLAAVRHYIWRQAGELLMQYRRKTPVQIDI